LKVPPSVLKLNVFGEIVSGKNFEYDDLYVYYCVDLADSKYPSFSFLLKSGFGNLFRLVCRIFNDFFRLYSYSKYNTIT
jgi:hypothetical protein